MGTHRKRETTGRAAISTSPAPAPTRIDRMVQVAFMLLMLGFVAFICAFKVMDRDFWWHVKAGEIMVTEQRMIDIDPFAHTREGLPYLSSHEWLAQVFLYLAHAAAGIPGVIALRTLLVAATALCILFIDPRRVWPNVFLVVVAVNAARPGLMDRPQLFTFLLLAAFLWLAYRVLNDEEWATKGEWSGAERLLPWFIPLEILWVNLHGAAALVGVGVTGAILLQRIAGWALATTSHERSLRGNGIGRAMTICIGMALAMLVSPSGFGNFTLLGGLLNDKTIAFIGEWKPREFGVYLKDLWPLWLLSLGSLFAVRKHFTFSAIMLGATGYLSLTAFRHEMLFTFTAAAVTIHQLRHSEAYTGSVAWIRARTWAFAATTVVLIGVTTYAVVLTYHRWAAPDHLYGYGVFDLARGATDFVERERIGGKMFNTYGIGGYELFRGYPDRKVYIDGRNVDYGFEFLSKTFAAQRDAEAWKKIEEEYGLTYAIIDYDAIKEWDHYPFATHLDKNTRWALVYLDDWAGVYLKEVPENAAIIAQKKISHVTPESLTSGLAWEADDEADLRRIAEENRDGIKARLQLARLYRTLDRFEEAEQEARAAIATQPLRATAHLMLAGTLADQQRWEEAAKEYAKADRFAVVPFSPSEYEEMASAAEMIDDHAAAAQYRKKAKDVPPIELPAMPSGAGDPNQAKAQELLRQLQEAGAIGMPVETTKNRP